MREVIPEGGYCMRGVLLYDGDDLEYTAMGGIVVSGGNTYQEGVGAVCPPLPRR